MFKLLIFHFLLLLFKFQKPHLYQELAKPPIPPINETFTKYMRNLKSILSHKQYEILEESVGKFIASSDSKQLQKLLELYASRNANWVTELWLDDMYLRWVRTHTPNHLTEFINTNFPSPLLSYQNAVIKYRYRSTRIRPFCYLGNSLRIISICSGLRPISYSSPNCSTKKYKINNSNRTRS